MSTDSRYTSLDLPATDYKLLDALDKIQLREGDLMYWEVEDFYDFGFLAPLLNDEASLYDLNALTKQLAMMDSYTGIAFEGLVKLDEAAKAGSIRIGRLIDLACSVEDCHVVDALTDEQLGRFYADNDFVPELDEVPDNLYEKLDFAKIGREMREKENGIFTNRGYVLHTEEVRQVYETLDTKPKKPNYMFRLELTSSLTGEYTVLDLPATQEQFRTALDEMSLESWDWIELHGFDGALPDLNIDLYHDRIDDLNALAQKVRELDNAGNLCRFKAILNANGSYDVESALTLADRLDEYVFSQDIRSLAELGMDQLRFSLTDESIALLKKHVNLEAYGEDIRKDENSELTPYGLIQREDGQPVMEAKNEPVRSDMQMI